MPAPGQTGKRPAGDGVITATELYQYLRDTVEPASIEHANGARRLDCGH
jgi:hypothetical protein